LTAESPEQLAAFAVYQGMGPDRSLDAVAEHVGRAPSTLRKWSIRFGWQGRLSRGSSPDDAERGEAERQLRVLRGRLLDYAERLPLDHPTLPQVATAGALCHSALTSRPVMTTFNNGRHS